MSTDPAWITGTDTTDHLTETTVLDGMQARGIDLDRLTVHPDGSHAIDLDDHGGFLALGYDETDDDGNRIPPYWIATIHGGEDDGERWELGGTLDAILDRVADHEQER